MKIKIRYENEYQTLEVENMELEKWLNISISEEESQEVYEKRVQDVIEERFNRPDYNSWHKHDRHTSNAYMKSKDGTVEVNTEEVIMFRAADKTAFNSSIDGVHNQLSLVKKQNLELLETVAVQNQQIAEMKPKASYYDVVLNCKDLVAISVIAKDYGWTANHMNQYLHEKGIQFKQGKKIWLLYKEYAEMGLTSTKTHTYSGSDGSTHSRSHTYWTQKGRLFIYDLLKKDGILPIMEQEG